MSDVTLPEDDYLEPQQLAELHKNLSEQLESLLAQSKDALSDLTDVRQQDADALDIAVNESNREFNIRLAERERRLMKKIRLALRRIQEGEYGTCESCGGEITYKRLLARPVATQCIDCKTEAESVERRRAF